MQGWTTGTLIVGICTSLMTRTFPLQGASGPASACTAQRCRPNAEGDDLSWTEQQQAR